MTAKHCNFTAVVLFLASLAMMLLGVDSEKRPTTIPYCTAGMIGVVVSIAVALIGLRRTSQEKRRTGV